jgi:type I restriction-modification system DNA methylase subunit
VRLAEPAEGRSVYDPSPGSGDMLIFSTERLREQGGTDLGSLSSLVAQEVLKSGEFAD